MKKTKIRAIQVFSDPKKILRILNDKDLVVQNLPYVAGIRDGKVVLYFRRFLILKFKDNYSIEVIRDNNRVIFSLVGDKSIIRITLIHNSNTIKYYIEYRGLKYWITSKLLYNIVESLIKSLDKIAMKRKDLVMSTRDFSEMLSKPSWITKVVMKSILLKNDIVVIKRGDLLEFIEKLAGEERIFDKYKAVYISGDAYNAKFRLLFINNELKGVYVISDEQVFIGDEKALENVNGLTKIRVYGILHPEILFK